MKNVIQQLVPKNMPFAILAQTETARKLKNKEVSFIHILRPFAVGNDIISQAKASWICGGLDIPNGEIFATENIFFKERMSERNGQFAAYERGVKTISVIESVRKLAEKVLELRVQSEIKTISPITPDHAEHTIFRATEVNFEDLLVFAAKNAFSDAKTAVQALKESIRREEMTTRAGNDQIVKACLSMLETGNSQSQREAAVVLATYDIGRTNTEWQEVLQGAMKAFAAIKEKDVETPLAKSIRYLISKGVHASKRSRSNSTRFLRKKRI